MKIRRFSALSGRPFQTMLTMSFTDCHRMASVNCRQIIFTLNPVFIKNFLCYQRFYRPDFQCFRTFRICPPHNFINCIRMRKTDSGYPAVISESPTPLSVPSVRKLSFSGNLQFLRFHHKTEVHCINIILKRLKIAGAWRKENNARNMISLRVMRVNGDWENYRKKADRI